METGNEQRQQLIRRAMTRSTDDAADAAIQLWQPLASQLISIIGEGGFNALYARSLYLTHAVFPWLELGNAPRSVDLRFTDLKISLEGQSATEATEASRMLLLTVTDILASLIGESLTTDILSFAWGDDASKLDIAGKEFPHD